MIELIIVLMILSVAVFSVWSMIVMNPLLVMITLVLVSVLVYFIDRDLKRG